MPDIEKVIKGLECCKVGCTDCPYRGISDCVTSLNNDAIELLKEQQKEIERIKRISNEMAKVALYK